MFKKRYTLDNAGNLSFLNKGIIHMAEELESLKTHLAIVKKAPADKI
jgi:hypothetical protein